MWTRTCPTRDGAEPWNAAVEDASGGGADAPVAFRSARAEFVARRRSIVTTTAGGSRRAMVG